MLLFRRKSGFKARRQKIFKQVKVGNHSKKLRFVGIINATPLIKINTMPTRTQIQYYHRIHNSTSIIRSCSTYAKLSSLKFDIFTWYGIEAIAMEPPAESSEPALRPFRDVCFHLFILSSRKIHFLEPQILKHKPETQG